MGLACSYSAVAIIIATVLSGVYAGIFIPDDIVTALGVIYSRLPPAKIGTDSRLGFGLKIGRNADAQFLFEFGPQTDTQELGNNVINKKRHTMSSKKYSNDRGWRWFINKTVNSKKQKARKKFIRATEIQPTVSPLHNYTEQTTTEMQWTMVDQKLFTSPTAKVSALTTRLPVSQDSSETTTVKSISVTMVPNQLYSSKYVENNTFDTNSIIEKYNKKQPMINADVFRLVNSLMNILPLA